MTFSNDEELQKKWKSIVSVTCCVQRTYAFVKDLVNKMVEAINVFLRNARSAFESLSEKFEKLSEVIKDTMDKYYKEEPRRVESRSYPHIYPPSVNNFKVNTKGYPNKILQCARSRC